MSASAAVRAAHRDDLPAIAEIYAHYVENTYITFDIEPLSLGAWQTKWHTAQALNHPWMVVVDERELLGFVTSGSYRTKPAYASTLETTIYLRPGAVGGGLGVAVYEAALREAGERAFHLAVAAIALPNERSVGLHERLGFELVGVFSEVGHKLGAWRDVGWWQCRLGPKGSGPLPSEG